MSILDNLEKLKALVKSELDTKNKEIIQLKEELETNKEKINKINELESELQTNEEKIQNLEHEKNELTKFKDEIEQLKNENSSLNKKLEGYRYSIKIISNWLPSQKESIDVLISLLESHEHTITFDDLHKSTKIPAVVLKNRVVPLLVEKGLVEVTVDSIKMLEIEE
ncbi:MAG: coiled-coil domain-containing protein [Candidatus Hodarchaeota archaeon]